MIETTWTVEDDDGNETEYTVYGNVTDYIAAVTNRDPYDCHPAEGGFCEEITEVEDPEGCLIDLKHFTDDEYDSMREAVTEAAGNL